MAVRQDKRGRWTVDILFRSADGSERRVTRTSAKWTKRDAMAWERDARRQLADGTFDQAHKEVPTLKSFAEEWLRTKRLRAATRDAWDSVLEQRLLPALGGKRLDEIDTRAITHYQADLEHDGLKAKTIRNHTSMLSQLLSTAVDWKVIKVKPKIVWPKVPPTRFDFLDRAEGERLIAAADGEWRAMIAVALHTGLRLGELRALRWDDVDLVRQVLVVRQAVSGHKNVIGPPKSGKDRPIPLNDIALAALRGQRHLRGPLVFCQAGGELLTRTDCRQPIWRACKRAGLRQVGWHVCRHSFASGLVMAGVPIKAVQELLGHATIQMTLRYSHLSPSVTRDAVQRLTNADIAQTPAGGTCAQRESA